MALAVLAVVLGLVFYDVVLLGRTLTTAATVFGVRGTEVPYGYPGQDPGMSAFLLDPLASAVASQPAAEHAHRLLRDGVAPLWNPHLGLGQPLLASAEPQVVSPLRLPLAVAPTPAMWDAFLLLRLYAAGAFTVLLARRLGLGLWAGLGAGLAYMLTGYQHLQVNTVHADAAAVLPALLLAVELLLARPGRVRLAVTGLAVACAALADNPQAAVVTLGVAVLYAAARIVGLRHDPPGGRRGGGRVTVRRVGAVAGALALGLGLAAVVLVPFAELTGIGGLPSLAVHGHGPGRGVGLRSLDPPAMVTLFLPWLYGPPTAPFDPSLRTELANYVGVVVPLLALLAIGDRERMRRYGWFLLAAAVLGAAKVYGVAAVQPLGAAPLLGAVNFVLYLPPAVDLFLAVLAGVGLQRVVEGRVGARAALLAALVLWSGVLALLQANAPLLDVVPAAAVRFVTWSPVGLTLVAVGAVIASRLPRMPGWVPAAVLLALVAAEAFVLSSPARGDLAAAAAVVPPGEGAARTRPLRHDPFLVPPTMGALGGGTQEPGTALGRVVGERTMLFPNTAQALGLHDLRSLSALSVGRYTRLVTAFLDPGANQRFTGLAWSPFEPTEDISTRTKEALLDLLGVRWVIGDPRPADLDRRRHAAALGLRLVADGAPVVYENVDVLPRAFVVHRVVPAADAEEAVARMGPVVRDPGGVAVVEGLPAEQLATLEPAVDLDSAAGAEADALAGAAPVVSHRANRVDVTVTLARPGLLVLSDTWYPGWTAEVDGRPAEIHPTDVALRGVYLEPGAHRVTFAFRSGSVRAGAAVSAAAALVVVWALATGLRRAPARRAARTHRRSSSVTVGPTAPTGPVSGI